TNAPQEVRKIVSDAADGGKGPFPGKILLDGQCTIDNIKHNLALHPSIFHVATHFIGTSNAGQEPYFLMAGGKQLSLSQWKQTLRLQGVSLLTLSACNTGVGAPDASGGEVSSIGELSQYLGAQSVIASLWSVDDEATSILMPDFYTRLHSNPQQGKAQALRAAQRALIGQSSSTQSFPRGKRGITAEGEATCPRSYAHPFYWAPFSLTGNWK
ncbi:MAG: CHAT domain-containing protein, partial [Cytophagaceae bacterium]